MVHGLWPQYERGFPEYCQRPSPRLARNIMTSMLEKIGETRSKVIILDISGVAMVDTAVANHLIKITRATSLMGCECIVSGLSPAIARTIVEELQVEDRLNEEVREVLVQHTQQMERSDITYSEMFKKVKRELAKQKGIVL